MPGFLFTPDQVATLIEVSGLGSPRPGSPLFPQPPDARRLHANHPAFTKLLDLHALESKGDGWRINGFLGAALRASLEPQEVISIGTGQQPRPRGFSVVRYDDFMAECTVDGDGNAKFYFPLSRSQLMLLIGDALTSAEPEPEPTGFRFVGTAPQAFVLSAAMRELREFPLPLTRQRLLEVVRSSVAIPGLVAPFVTTAGAAAIEELALSDESVEFVLRRLLADGHLRSVDGHLEPSPAAAIMLAEYPDKSFAVSRAVVENATVKTQTLNVSRVGGRTLVFRIRYPADGPPRFEWAEVDRAQLRTLVTALMMTEEQLRLSTAAGDSAGEAAAGPPPDAIAPPAVNFCPYCGSPSGKGFRFCPACGREVPTI
jgi:hypothetical protein